MNLFMLWVAGGSMRERMCVTAPAATRGGSCDLTLLYLTLHLVSLSLELFNDYYLLITQSGLPMCPNNSRNLTLPSGNGGTVEDTLGRGLAHELQNPSSGISS